MASIALRTDRLALLSTQGLGECPPIAPRNYPLVNADETGLVPPIFGNFLRATRFAYYATNLVLLSKVYLPIPVRLHLEPRGCCRPTTEPYCEKSVSESAATSWPPRRGRVIKSVVPQTAGRRSAAATVFP